jgi:hypothetical protein
MGTKAALAAIVSARAEAEAREERERGEDVESDMESLLGLVPIPSC